MKALEVAPETATPEVCRNRSQIAMTLAPHKWMENMATTLRVAARQTADPQAVIQSAVDILRGSHPPELTPDELMTFGTAVMLMETHPEHLAKLVTAAGPWIGWRPQALGPNKDSKQALGFGSALHVLRYCVIADDEWVKNCRSPREGAMVLGQCQKIAPTVRDWPNLLEKQEKAWLDQQTGSVRTLGEALQRKGQLAGGLARLYEAVPELDQHLDLAVRVLSLTPDKDRAVEDTVQGLNAVLRASTEEEGLQTWLKGTLSASGGMAVELGGLKPSVGGVLLRRKRT
jgi:hypothetical protein